MTTVAHEEGASNAPLLAYVYHPRSFATFSLVEAARGVCRLLWVVDTTNEETASMARLLKRYGLVVDVAGLSYDEAAAVVREHSPGGILALADDALYWTSELAARLELPFLSPETALRLTDKHQQRAALARGGLAVPRSIVIKEDHGSDSWEDVEGVITFPAVLKPRRGEGSRDTLPVSSIDQLRALWSEIQASKKGTRDFVLEEYIADAPDAIAGESFAGYVSVESYVQGGAIRHLAINGRMPPAHPFRETGFFIPSALDDELGRAVFRVAGDAATAIGVMQGCLHTEIKLTPNGPIVIEVNGRIGGGVPEMIELVSDVQFLSISMQLAIGKRVTVARLPRSDRIGYLFYVQAPANMVTVTAIEGLNELAEIPGVKEIALNRGPGQSVDWHEGNHGHVFSVLGSVSNHDELRDIYRHVLSLVHIEGDLRPGTI